MSENNYLSTKLLNKPYFLLVSIRSEALREQHLCRQLGLTKAIYPGRLSMTFLQNCLHWERLSAKSSCAQAGYPPSSPTWKSQKHIQINDFPYIGALGPGVVGSVTHFCHIDIPFWKVQRLA